MNILITGGAGFIGSYLVDLHMQLGDTVTVVDNLSTGKLENIQAHLKKPNFKFYHADMLAWPELEQYTSKVELIYHFAAVVGMFNVLEHPIATLHTNLNITERLFAATSKSSNKPLVFVASSSEVYGSKTTSMKELDPLMIESSDKAHASYPISKLCNETMALAYHHEKQIPVIVLRIFNTVGPRQSSRYGMVLPRFIQQALSHEPLSIFSTGEQTRSFCDVRDLANILYQLSKTPNAIGKIVNAGSDQTISILSLANLVIQLTGSQAGYSFKSFEEMYGEGYIDIENRRPDLTKLQGLITYRYEWPLEKTIRYIIEHINPLSATNSGL